MAETALPRPGRGAETGVQPPSAARSTAARSILTIPVMVSISRRARSRSGSQLAMTGLEILCLTFERIRLRGEKLEFKQ